jgi:hypothetical protein
MSYWRGCIYIIKPSGSCLEKKEKEKRKRVLTKWEEFVLTLVRLRKGFDIHFLADTLSISAALLIGITLTDIISFVPPLCTGSISDKEIVRNSGLLDMLEEGDAVMADKGFLIRDLLTFKKVYLLSPAYCRGPRLSARGTTHTRRIASLRTHVERNILKLKQFRIISGVIPLLLKPMLDRIVFLCAALSNLGKRSIK